MGILIIIGLSDGVAMRIDLIYVQPQNTQEMLAIINLV